LTDIEGAIDFVEDREATLARAAVDLKLSELVKGELLGRYFTNN
jgi:hypothetical protein